MISGVVASVPNRSTRTLRITFAAAEAARGKAAEGRMGLPWESYVKTKSIPTLIVVEAVAGYLRHICLRLYACLLGVGAEALAEALRSGGRLEEVG